MPEESIEYRIRNIEPLQPGQMYFLFDGYGQDDISPRAITDNLDVVRAHLEKEREDKYDPRGYWIVPIVQDPKDIKPK